MYGSQMAESASLYLKELDAAWIGELDQLLLLLKARLAQSYGHWNESRRGLVQLEAEPELWPPIVPYVDRVYGHDLARSSDFAGAISHYQAALKVFQETADRAGEAGESLDPAWLSGRRSDADRSE